MAWKLSPTTSSYSPVTQPFRICYSRQNPSTSPNWAGGKNQGLEEIRWGPASSVYQKGDADNVRDRSERNCQPTFYYVHADIFVFGTCASLTHFFVFYENTLYSWPQVLCSTHILNIPIRVFCHLACKNECPPDFKQYNDCGFRGLNMQRIIDVLEGKLNAKPWNNMHDAWGDAHDD